MLTPDSQAPPASAEPDISEHEKQPKAAPFPIVGIGASAGGLEAFTSLLSALPVTTGMAFVLIQHLDPAHESQLTHILSRATTMPVHQITDGMAIEPNSIYVIPPNTRLSIADKSLRLEPRTSDQIPYVLIDHFFESLAAEQGRLSIGVILSGSGADGSLGLKAIKSQCGITFVQTEASARFGGMPHSAIATGAADFVLPPIKIAEELARVSTHPYVVTAPQEGSQELLPDGEFELRKIFGLVHRMTGVDFSHYKQATTRRRIGRRMIVHRSQSLGEYLNFLRAHPEEIQELHQDILISVTNFFRDPKAFAALAPHLRPLIRGRDARDTFRVWVPGCATGEEVYSLAICLHELFEEESAHLALQIFGTDISELALGKARSGRYPESIIADLSPERLHRYFHKTDGHYQISKTLRDCCIFAKQDLTCDPPFSRVDLVSCRNTLIYLDQVLQKAVMPVFHYSLKDSGVLFLGTSESVGSAADLFQVVDREHRIYSRKAVPVRFTLSPFPAPNLDLSTVPSFPAPLNLDWQRQADQLIQNRYAPDGVIINQDLTVLQTRGRVGYYLQASTPGRSQNLLLLAHDDLQFQIREAVAAAITHNSPVLRKGLRLEHGGEQREINLEVIPLSLASARERHYFVVFEHLNASPERNGEMPPAESKPETLEQENARLKQQIAQTHDFLRTLAEEHEAALEEQKASNEEISSANEELQSTNEELSTAKEELQSTNEELTTVNEELQNRNQELDVAVNDLNNLFAVVNTPILIFDRELLLRRFTPAAERHLGVASVDLGRFIADLPSRTSLPQLEPLLREVVDSLSAVNHEIQDQHRNWWSTSVRPYCTLDHRIEGAVVTFSDVNSIKHNLQRAEDSLGYAEAIIETVREPLIVLYSDLRIERANQAFYRTFQLSRENVDGKPIYNLDDGEWDIPELRHLLERILPLISSFEHFPVEHEFARLGWRSMSLNARGILHQDRSLDRILLAIEDVTERKVAEKKLLQSHADLEQFGYAVAHDVQEPLRAIDNYAQLLAQRHGGQLGAESNRMLEFLMDGVSRLRRMVQDLLAYSQAGDAGNNLLEPVNVKAALNEALWNLKSAIDESGATITYGDLPTIDWVSRLLAQVFQNLLGNAIKYRRQVPPQIHIQAVRGAQEWMFSVRDNGKGFDQRYAGTIFGVFQRLEANKHSGTGIGLAICERVITRAGGRIWAESQEGVGSTFHFTVPIHEARAESSNEARA